MAYGVAAQASPGLRSMKQLEVLLFPVDRMPVGPSLLPCFSLGFLVRLYRLVFLSGARSYDSQAHAQEHSFIIRPKVSLVPSFSASPFIICHIDTLVMTFRWAKNFIIILISSVVDKSAWLCKEKLCFKYSGGVG